jgi:multiple sugar transport system substrate-binding protein
MASEILQVALISGGMYDALYESLPQFTQETGAQVHIAFRGTHPELNAHIASLKEVPYHLISTHTKYAPSQLAVLAPLDDFDPGDMFPALLEMARIDGKLYGVPRNMDAKLLHYRSDLMAAVPQSWDELVRVAQALTGPESHGFVLTGKESGMFGMFYELAEMGGATLFPDDDEPKLNNEGGVFALGTLRALYGSGAVPKEVVNWHYDEAHRYFRERHAAMICDYPGFYASYCAAGSPVRGRFKLARMPGGPSGIHRAYAGAHTLALTSFGAGKKAAHALLNFLTSAERQLVEAKRGSVPVRRSVMDAVRNENPTRWTLLEQVIDQDTLVPPRLAYYPEIEEILWRTVQAAMMGLTDIEPALCEMQTRIRECHRRHKTAGVGLVS